MRFWIRSSRRDESTDANRLGSIERSVLDAIADAEKERKGFTKRIEEVRGRASMLMGSETFDYVDRDEKTEQQLQASERVLIAANSRIRQLTAHLEHLRRILEILKQR